MTLKIKSLLCVLVVCMYVFRQQYIEQTLPIYRDSFRREEWKKNPKEFIAIPKQRIQSQMMIRLISHQGIYSRIIFMAYP